MQKQEKEKNQYSTCWGSPTQMVASLNKFHVCVKPRSPFPCTMLLCSHWICITNSGPYPHRLCLCTTETIPIPEARAQILPHVEIFWNFELQETTSWAETIPSTSPLPHFIPCHYSSWPMSLDSSSLATVNGGVSLPAFQFPARLAQDP